MLTGHFSLLFDSDSKNGDYTIFMHTCGISSVALMWIDGNGIELSSVHRSNMSNINVMQFDLNMDQKLNIIGVDEI